MSPIDLGVLGRCPHGYTTVNCIYRSCKISESCTLNLHSIASGVICSVNPLIAVTVKISTGYIINPDGTQVPTYTSVGDVLAQIQSLTYSEVLQTQGLNLQGTRRAIYLNGRFEGLDREEKKGGDLIVYPSGTDWPYGTTWLIAQVLEQWPDWCKVVVTRQLS